MIPEVSGQKPEIRARDLGGQFYIKHERQMLNIAPLNSNYEYRVTKFVHRASKTGTSLFFEISRLFTRQKV